MKKLLSMVLVLSLLFTFTAFADDNEGDYNYVPPQLARRVSIAPYGSTTLSVGQDLPLGLNADGEYGSAEWSSSNSSVAYVDSYGYVYANKSGTARITVNLYAIQDHSRLCSASINITVKGSSSSSSSTSIKRVTVTSNDSTTMTVKKSAQLRAKITPSDADYESVEWDSSDASIVYVSPSGRITANKKGEATIYATVYGEDSNGRYKALSSGSIDITVQTSSGSSSYYEPDDHVVSSRKISSASLTNAVKTEVKKGKTTYAHFDNYVSVSAESLQAAATAMKQAGGTVMLNFDTRCDIDDFEGRVTINPNSAANLKGNLSLLVHTEESYVASIKDKFSKTYNNTFMVAKVDQHGGYGMKVTYTLPVAKGLKNVSESKLVAYSYNSESNKLTILSDSELIVDTKGFVRLTTSASDYIIISNGKLAK